jgi:hypothetical protein
MTAVSYAMPEAKGGEMKEAQKRRSYQTSVIFGYR